VPGRSVTSSAIQRLLKRARPVQHSSCSGHRPYWATPAQSASRCQTPAASRRHRGAPHHGRRVTPPRAARRHSREGQRCPIGTRSPKHTRWEAEGKGPQREAPYKIKPPTATLADWGRGVCIAKDRRCAQYQRESAPTVLASRLAGQRAGQAPPNGVCTPRRRLRARAALREWRQRR
jgi:hypothetical protein